MGFFDNLFKKSGVMLGAPMKGECVELKEVSDPTFGEGILGKGIAIKPESGEVYAPADATVSTVFPTGHAVALTTEDGTEILIHVGLDTVNLKGLHFDVKVETDQQVKKGDLLVVADIEQIKAAGYDVITPMVICNTDDFAEVEGITGKAVVPGDDVIRLKK